MRIVKQGTVPVESLIYGKCDECGCEAEFYPREGYRNASIEDHRSWYPTNYYVDCPTKNCNGKVSGWLAPKTSKPSLFDRFFNY